MNLHQEHHFEGEVCASMATNGWSYAAGRGSQEEKQQADLVDIINKVNGLFEGYSLPSFGILTPEQCLEVFPCRP